MIAYPIGDTCDTEKYASIGVIALENPVSNDRRRDQSRKRQEVGQCIDVLMQ